VPTHFVSRLAFAGLVGLTLWPEGLRGEERKDAEWRERERRAIRGAEPDDPAELLPEQILLDFERANFPASGQSPWIEPDPGAAPAPAETTEVPGWMRRLELPNLPITWSPELVKYLTFYKEDRLGRAIMRDWLEAQARYEPLIRGELKKAGLPEDLIYVAMIESSYDPNRVSPVGATGLWQFMPAGADIYGLRRDHWVDERRDPVLSTRAVVDAFKDLYHRFGKWDLALAGFNCGYGAVLSAITKYNTNDFWSLRRYENGLPWMCSLYVPKALAAAVVGHNRDAFGFKALEPAAAFAFEDVEVPGGLRLETLARAAGVTRAALEQLNPQLRRGRTPPGDDHYRVRVPVGRKPALEANLPRLQKELEKLSVHRLAQGERLEDVATTYGISERELRRDNAAGADTQLPPGTPLLVPALDAATREKNRSKADEDLYASGVPKGQPGDKLLVAVLDPQKSMPGKHRVFYRVVAGDSLSGVAAAFQVKRADLATWNGLDADARLHPRMVLEVWIDKRFQPERRGIALLDPERLILVERGSSDHLEQSEERIGRKRMTYRPKKPESFEVIGKRFGLTAHDMARINQKPSTTVVGPGESCIVYEVENAASSPRAREQAQKKNAGGQGQ
jgi:membrane-bound lytic murein transglycosylase D